MRLKSGYIVFPKEVKGWYYGTEIIQVKKYCKLYPFIELKILEEIKIELGEKILDNDIQKFYKTRLALKKKKDQVRFQQKKNKSL